MKSFCEERAMCICTDFGDPDDHQPNAHLASEEGEMVCSHPHSTAFGCPVAVLRRSCGSFVPIPWHRNPLHSRMAHPRLPPHFGDWRFQIRVILILNESTLRPSQPPRPLFVCRPFPNFQETMLSSRHLCPLCTTFLAPRKM